MKFGRIAITCLMALAIAGIAFAALHGPSVRAQIANDQIVFASNRSGNYEIYLLNPTTGLTTQLTNSPTNDIEPAWSPDGTLIAFASDRDGDYELYVMRADGTDVRQLTNNLAEDRQPRWQPDGLNIVFVSDVNNQWDLYAISPDGAIVRQLTNDTADERGPGMADGLMPGTNGAGAPVATQAPPTDTADAIVDTLSYNRLNVRPYPGEGSVPIVATLERGTAVDIVGRYIDNSWVQIQLATGETGWVLTDLLQININLATVPVVNAPYYPGPTDTPTPTNTPTPNPAPVIEFKTSNGTITAGECVTISWRVENIKEVYYNDVGVTGNESREECPTVTTTYKLTVVKLDNTIDERFITITVN